VRFIYFFSKLIGHFDNSFVSVKELNSTKMFHVFRGQCITELMQKYIFNRFTPIFLATSHSFHRTNRIK